MLRAPDNHVRLVLVRHAELAEADRTRAVGQGDAAVSRRSTDHTIEVLRALAGLTVERVVTAPAAQCRMTATAIAGDRRLEVIVEPRLHDQSLGDWEGRDWADLQVTDGTLVREFFREYGAVAPPGGETLNDAVDRWLGWWSDVSADVTSETVVMVGASPVIAGFAARLLGLPLGRSAALALPPSAFGVLDVFGDGAALRCWHPLALSDSVP